MAKTLLPDDFEITEAMRYWARSRVPHVDIDKEHENFCDYWRAHGKKMADWTATWRMWMRRTKEMKGALKQPQALPNITFAPRGAVTDNRARSFDEEFERRFGAKPS